MHSSEFANAIVWLLSAAVVPDSGQRFFSSLEVCRHSFRMYFLLPTRVLTSSLYHPAVVSFLFYPMPSSCRMPFTTISADLLWLHSSGKSSPIHRRPLRDGSLSSSCPSGDLKVQDFPRGVELSRSFATFCPFPTRLISKIRASVTAAAAKYPSVLSQLRQVTISMDFAQPR